MPDLLAQKLSTVANRRYRNFAPFVRQTGERKAQTCAMAIYQQRSAARECPHCRKAQYWFSFTAAFRSQGSGTSSGSSEDGVRASRLEHPRTAQQPGACLVSELVLAARGHIRP